MTMDNPSHPPHTAEEMRLLLCQYLDGALTAEHMVEVDRLIETNAAYKEELLRQQTARGSLKSAINLETADEAVPPASLWAGIAAQLEADETAEPLAADPEFISAYYDGEISASDPELQAFEAQLPGNDEANRMLADLGAVSEAVRRFGYRLEESCTLALTQQVMAALNADEGLADVTPEDSAEAPADPVAEMVSAYFDQELSARETIEANRLIEGNPDARRLLGNLNALSEQIRGIAAQMEAQAPDCTTSVMEVVALEAHTEAVASKKVAALAGRRRLRQWAVPAAAAVLLLVLAFPLLSGQTALQGGNMAQESRELASVPMASSLSSAGRMMASDEAAMDRSGDLLPAPMAMPQAPVLQDASFRREAGSMPATVPLAPMLEPESPLASTETRTKGISADMVKASRQTPSSEEYLFNALSEQMPEEDISALLGQ